MSLHDAARQGDVEAGLAIIKESPKTVHQADKLQRTPLHMACWAGKADFVQMLLEKKASVKVTAIDDVTPLCFAAQSGSAECCRLLLAKGAKVNVRNSKNQKSPLHLAAEKGHLEVVQLLMAAGAKPQSRTNKQKTAEDLAATPEIKEAIRQATEQRLAELQKRSAEGGEEVGEEAAKAGEEEKGVKRSAAEEVEGEGADQTEEKAKAKKPKKAQATAPLSFNLDEENEEDLL